MRWVLRFQAVLAWATTRRVVRSEPEYPMATRRSWTTSARIFPDDLSTHASILSAKVSVTLPRGGEAAPSVPAARVATKAATVWWSTPVSSAALR
jgi:hypothetical protein